MFNNDDWPAIRAKLAFAIDAFFAPLQPAGRTIHRYALADAAQIEQFRGERFAWLQQRLAIPHISLFTLTQEQPIAAYGPLLISLDADASASHSLVGVLLQMMSYGWTVSWLTSTLEPEPLAQHLAGHLNGTLADETKVLVRYYDPRLLPEFLIHLDSQTKKALLGPIGQWAFWDRKLNLLRCRGGNLAESAGVKTCEISEKAQAALAEAAVPDLLVSMLIEEMDSETLAQWLPHALYNAVVEQIGAARRYGLTELADLQLFLSLAFEIHPKFQHILDIFGLEKQRVQDGEVSFSDLVLKVADHEWNYIGNHAAHEMKHLRDTHYQELLSRSNFILELDL